MNNIRIFKKPKLFFNKYKYRAVICNPNFHLVRYCKTEEQLHNNISYRQQSGVYFYHGRRTDEVDKVPLIRFIHWRNNQSKDITIRIDYDMISVYGNDLFQLQTIEYVDSNVDYSEVKLEGDPSILERNNPKHKYRTYFRCRSLQNADLHTEMQKFLQSYEKSVYPCGALRRWAFEIKDGQNWRKHYLEASFFVDYDTESIQTILGLTFDNYLGKTYKVEQRD